MDLSERKRLRGDDGAILIFLGLSIAMLLIVAALVPVKNAWPALPSRPTPDA